MQLKFNRILFFTLLFVVPFIYGCKKNDSVAHNISPSDTTSKLVFLLVDSRDTLASQLWKIPTNSATPIATQLKVTLPAEFYFEFFDDFGLGVLVSPDKTTFDYEFAKFKTYTPTFYASNADGSSLKEFFSAADTDITTQCFINNLSVLYWQQTSSVNNGELRKVNTDGSGDQQINIALPPDAYFNPGYFAKATPDGKNIIFSVLTYADSTVTGSRIYESGIDGSKLTTIATLTGGNIMNVAAIVNNTIFYYRYNVNEGPPQTLWEMNLDGSNDHQIQLNLPSGTNLPNGSFNLTPQAGLVVGNGKMYFVAFDGNLLEYIYSANLDGSNLKLFYTAPADKFIYPCGIGE
jgi:hypothetical protein